MVPGIDPKIDYAFKRVFGTERNRAVVIAMLNAVLERPPVMAITDLELLNPFNEKETFDDKLSIVDVKARDQLGRQYNVEMQMLGHVTFLNRALYYWSRLHQQQLLEGEKYSNLRPTISVLFVNEVLFPDVTEYHLRFALRDDRHGLALSDHLELHLIELPKFKVGPTQSMASLEKWLYFLRHAASLDTAALPLPLQVPEIRQAMGELVMVSEQELDRFRYEDRFKARMDELNKKFMFDEMLEQAQTKALKAQEEGRKEGLTEGRKEGLTEGRKEGLTEGRKIGELIGRIHICQRATKQTLTPEEELLKLSTAELEWLAGQLEQQLLAGK